jgi:arsenate reductase (thioredoxin)
MQFDYVISYCDEAKASCLSFPRDAHNLYWTCPDPAREKGTDEAQREAFRNAREHLRKLIEAWLPGVQRNAPA